MKKPSKYSPKRLAWLCLGLLCVGLGTIGIILPLMPTTVFLLIAAYAFARSSPKLYDWLLGHRFFGPIIKNWREYKAISLRAKRASIISMIVIILLSWLVKAPILVITAQTIILAIVASFILTRPNPPTV